MSWATEKMEQLEKKGKDNWDVDDYEAYVYCQECFAEDDRDAEYLGAFSIYF